MKKIIYIPEGPTNLASLFPQVYFPDVTEYYIQAFDENDEVIMSTRNNKYQCRSDIRFLFINSIGQPDYLNFKFLDTAYSSKSDVWEQSRPNIFNRLFGGRFRQNINSEESLEFETSFYLEEDLKYLKDFVNSPIHLIEREIEGEGRDYIPFIIDNSDIPQKADDVFEFQIRLKGKLSNRRINFRS